MTSVSPRSCIFTILSVSHDAVVLATRNAVLRQAGYTVVTTMKEDEALDLVRKGGLDAVVLGDSISAENRFEVAEAMKQVNPHVPIIVIKLAGESVPEGCLTMDSLDGPQALLTKLSQLLTSSDAQAA